MQVHSVCPSSQSLLPVSSVLCSLRASQGRCCCAGMIFMQPPPLPSAVSLPCRPRQFTPAKWRRCPVPVCRPSGPKIGLRVASPGWDPYSPEWCHSGDQSAIVPCRLPVSGRLDRPFFTSQASSAISSLFSSALGTGWPRDAPCSAPCSSSSPPSRGCWLDGKQGK